MVRRRRHRGHLAIDPRTERLESGSDLLSDRRVLRPGSQARNFRIPLALRHRRGHRPVFELSTGLFVDRARVELSFRQRWNDLDQMFLSVTNYEGVAMEDRVNSTVTSDTRRRSTIWPCAC